ncbi:MAG: hypothetical protein EO766_17240 [Hydrotalea sp. AMD]|uniref:DUF6794 domain-containing protein n=1 Tax=Hydrotalea sp. AMD TaxID=2501297 RepID=UPI001027EE48|nr:DUF6794 domain-containing protein [Hydrotalea sp. AMD]RWZ84364.1 MAG: hypothetical protein EO766_17240 [Hydrotalea sp. AMD]
MNEQIKEIIQKLYEQLKNDSEFFELEKEELIKFHHTLGRHIRNEYDLWSIPWEPVIIDNCDYSPFHPDQVSMTIIEQVWELGQK